MTHLTREELERWMADGAADDRGTVVAHLAECDACLAACATMVRERPPEAGPVRFDPAEFIPRGLAARRPARRAWWHGRLTPGRLAAATMAVVLVVLVGPAVRDTLAPPEPVPSRTRGAATVAAVAPSGPVAAPVAFRWSAQPGADRYQVDVYDAGRQAVGSFESRDTSADAPVDLAARLEPGGQYAWSVTALDRAGQPIATSALVRFVVAR